MAVERDGGVDDGGIGGELVAPEIEGEDDEGVGVVGGVVGCGEEAAEGGLDAEHGEVVAGDDLGVDDVGGCAAAEAGVAGGGGEQAGEGLVLVAEILVHGVGEVVGVVAAPAAGFTVPGGIGGFEDDERGGIVDGKRAQQGLIEEREDGGVGADAEREGEDGGEREAGGAAELAECELEVLLEAVHDGSYYSLRSTVLGSTWAARRAGMRVAASAMSRMAQEARV